MNIQMAGIDHTRADIREREAFTLTASALEAALGEIAQQYPHRGCVIIATCNRTELYLSGRAEADPGPAEMLQALKGRAQDPAELPQDILVLRTGMDAVEHLFRLTCGLQSPIRGEHQILSQVKAALSVARKAHATDSTLERMFQMAIRCAKRVKTEAPINRDNASIASVVVNRLRSYGEEQGLALAGLPCLVLGNGVVGRETATHLARLGCGVTITQRRHHQGERPVPPGCEVLDYATRYDALRPYRVIISATVSPHYTLTWERLAPVWDGRPRLLLDLAMPRDIDPALRALDALTLLDLDDLGRGVDSTKVPDEGAVKTILQEELRTFCQWHAFRPYAGRITAIQQAAAADLLVRLNRPLKALALAPESADYLHKTLSHATYRVVGKLLFGLQETLPAQHLDPCLTALETLAGSSAPCPQYHRGDPL
ncbi:MAG: hypothetical protein LBD74_04355 [Spirochaetaceae bacterium]|jgi:glutamyl-tRNA reductase|nr:hypothetical protein [Spirochaetaceae bacterium]